MRTNQLLSIGFISYNKNDEIAERNEEKLFKDFIGKWTFLPKSCLIDVKSIIQGEGKYNTNKTLEVV